MGDEEVSIKVGSLGMARSLDVWQVCGCILWGWGGTSLPVCVRIVPFISCAPLPITYLSMIFLCGFRRMVEREQDIGSQEKRKMEREKRESLRKFAKDVNVDA